MNEKLLKQSIEDFSKALQVYNPTEDEIDKADLATLKELYVEKNPYPRPKEIMFGDSWSEWNFDHSDRINYLLRKLKRKNREDLLADFEEFKLQEAKKAEDVERKEIADNLSEHNINLIKLTIENPELLEYIIYLEKRIKRLDERK